MNPVKGFPLYGDSFFQTKQLSLLTSTASPYFPLFLQSNLLPQNTTSSSLSVSVMATPETLKNIFKKPVPVQDSLSSWTHLLPKAETETSFDMFGEICHRVAGRPPPVPGPSARPVPRLDKSPSWNGHMSDADDDDNAYEIFGELCYKARPEEIEVGSPENYEDADDGRGERKSKKVVFRRSCSAGESKGSGGSFPPPITSIGRCGKPRVYFKSFRQDGRFVLREIRIPTQRLLQSTREDGRLRMQVLGPVEDVRGRGEEKGGVENGEGCGEGGE